MTSTRVFVDASVLYSRTLRDWLLMLKLWSSEELFTVYWSEDVLAETISRLRDNHPDWPGRKTTTIRDRIVETLEGGRVEDFIVDGSFPGKDKHDQHVHAAAVACGADYLLTSDNGFFTAGEDADSWPYEAYKPDEFFILVDDHARRLVQLVTEEQTRYWVRMSGRADLAGPLIEAGCPRFAERVRSYQGQLSLPGDASREVPSDAPHR